MEQLNYQEGYLTEQEKQSLAKMKTWQGKSYSVEFLRQQSQRLKEMAKQQEHK